ncbi:amidohydrolase family protein, partial [bacterium]|nr:amidohydrolase family protein [bacterium]
LLENNARLMKTFNKFDPEIYMYLVEQAAKHHLPVTHDPGAPLFNHMPMDRAMDIGIRCFEHAKAPLPVVLKPEYKTAHDHLIYSSDSNTDKKLLLTKIFNAGTNAIDRKRLDTFIRDVISRDVYFCFTLHILESIKQFVTSKPKDEKEAQRIMISKSFVEISLLLARIMIQHGVKILVGHDGCKPENTIREMELLRECGLREAAIIKGATLYPAQWLGIDHQTGTITETKSADIVVLDKNPLENIAHIRSVHAIVKKGCWIDI